MKYLLVAAILLFASEKTIAQGTTEEEEVKKVVQIFFEGFHAKDSIVMKSVFHDQPVIQTIGRDQEGGTLLITENLNKLLRGIVSIPENLKFQEVLHDFVIRIDGPMANAWTPYSFYMNEEFSHCGVNNFQLIKQKGEWQIISLIDTRRKEGCQQDK